MNARLAKHHLNIDASDLGLIVEQLCRAPGSHRRFFIYRRQDGGYGF